MAGRVHEDRRDEVKGAVLVAHGLHGVGSGRYVLPPGVRGGGGAGECRVVVGSYPRAVRVMADVVDARGW